MKNIYIYPEARSGKRLNPYLDDLEAAIKTQYHRVAAPSMLQGVQALLFAIPKTDVFVLNWIEDIPKRRFGLLQVPFVFLFVLLCKWKGATIVWTLHNKLSHNPSFWTVRIIRLLYKHADVLLAHAQEAFTWYEQLLGPTAAKKYYRMHPTKVYPELDPQERVNDILIWGSVTAYKGVDDFLEFLKDNALLHKYRIRIIGKFGSEAILEKVMKFQSEKVQIENRSISFEDLNVLIAQSKIVLFTYRQSSVLSSGALMDSISMNGNVIGPNIGAFKDLNEIGVVRTYHDFQHLVSLLDGAVQSDLSHANSHSQFIQENIWANYAPWLNCVLEGKND